MADYTELKRLAEAANAVAGDARVEMTIASEPGPNQAEIDAVTAFMGAATPAAVVALIAEIERLNAKLEQARVIGRISCNFDAYEKVLEERDRIKGENELLREEVALDDKIITDRDRLLNMFECPEHGQCIPYAMEQIEVLRKDAERYRWLRQDDVEQCRISRTWSEEQMDAAIDAAMGKGEQS